MNTSTRRLGHRVLPLGGALPCKLIVLVSYNYDNYSQIVLYTISIQLYIGRFQFKAATKFCNSKRKISSGKIGFLYLLAISGLAGF